MPSPLSQSLSQACIECAQGLFDIFRIGATVLDDPNPEDDATHLRNDLLQIGDDFHRIMLQIESGELRE